MKNKPYLTVIAPIYNEQENITLLFDELAKSLNSINKEWEAIFVDDGSNDQSLHIIQDLAHKHDNLSYISFKTNCGQSTAFAQGFLKAQGEIIVTIDADLQNDPSDIPKMLELFEQGYDMVTGWRVNRQDSKSKKIASKIGNSIRNALTHEVVHDTGCSLKLMRTSIAKQLPMFHGMHRFLPTLMKMYGAKVTELAVNHRARQFGSSKYSTFGRGFTAFQDLIAVNWMQRRLKKVQIADEKIIAYNDEK